ncbi:type II TA system antitoxin MqsA family protein [Reichenbachiella ulvae]|uniref:DUF4065 domain-containing protein n=1 Tax=Reichenbachiella ulvae TaxID=2980104 RepID=A0ABT3CWI7_9BACT|nr:type II TA system antitoxin MqsA family protein [Reichenbachiella ulvae]MCV9388075.1 DUF4065 domain-containing protein [Reichenbachiella ulvae]
MNSPITGKEMQLSYEWRTIPFRKEQFEIPYQFYLCEDSGEQFTTTEVDELNMRMVYNQFRTKHHIPLPDEIRSIREQYEVSASRMGEILGFGPNTYGQYEKGDLPSLANAKLLKMANDPEKFLDLVKDWETSSDKPKADLLKRVRKLIDQENSFINNLESYLMGGHKASHYTGFKTPDYEKLTEMIVFFAQEVPCYKTKMNKLLFYSDFLMFKQQGHSVSGAMYKAIPYGPVPNSFESIFESLAKKDVIDIWYDELPEGGQKQYLQGRKDRPLRNELFSENEMMVLDTIKSRFKDTKPYEIVEISHQEKGWIDNEVSRSYISYHYAFDLKAL